MKKRRILNVFTYFMMMVMIITQMGMYVSAEEDENENEEVLDSVSQSSIEDENEYQMTEDAALGSYQYGEWVAVTYDGQVVDSITVNNVTVNAVYVTYSTRQSMDVGTNVTYSCAAFVKRFYQNVYGVDVYNLSGTNYTPLSSSGGSFTAVSSPQVGDIMRDNENTHWAIVKSVQSDGVVIIQQNCHWEKDGVSHGNKNGKVGTRNVTYFRYSGNADNGNDPLPNSFHLVNGKRYVIQSALSHMAIEVSSGDTTNRKQLNVWMFTYPGDRWQTWIAEQQSNGYVFKNAGTGMAMDIRYASQDEGAQVTQCTVDGAASQTFKVYYAGSGLYGLINSNSNKAVYVNSADEGSVLNQGTWSGAANQLWYFEPADREYSLSLNPNGGAFLDGNTSTQTPSIKLQWGTSNWRDVSGYAVTRSGYTFDGWYTAAEGGTKIYDAAGATVNDGAYWRENNYYYEGNLTVYAHWKNNTPTDPADPTDPTDPTPDNPDDNDENEEETIKSNNTIVVKGKLDVSSLIRNKTNYRGSISKYTSSDKAVAKVTKKGIVTGKRQGSAIITAYAKAGKSYTPIGSITVNIKAPVFNIPSGDLTYPGASVKLSSYVSNVPDGLSVIWTANAKSGVATINSKDGTVVAGNRSGKVKVTCAIGNGIYAAKYKFTMRIKIPKIKSSIKVKVGKTKKVTLSNVSSGTYITWKAGSKNVIQLTSTSKPNVVKINGLKNGTTTLMATVDGHDYIAYVTVGYGGSQEEDNKTEEVMLKNITEIRKGDNAPRWEDNISDCLSNKYENALYGVSAYGSWREYEINKQYITLSTTVSFPKSYEGVGMIKIYGDNILLNVEETIITSEIKPFPLTVDLRGISVLRIYVSSTKKGIYMCDPKLTKGNESKDLSGATREVGLNRMDPWEEKGDGALCCLDYDYGEKDVMGNMYWISLSKHQNFGFGQYAWCTYDLTTDTNTKFTNGKPFNRFTAIAIAAHDEAEGSIKIYGDKKDGNGFQILKEIKVTGSTKGEQVDIDLTGIVDFKIYIDGGGARLANPKMKLIP